MSTTTRSKVPVVILALAVACFLLPGARSATFSGVPFTSTLELTAGVVVGSIVFESVRERWARLIGCLRSGALVALLLATSCAIAGKATHLAYADDTAFVACHRSLVDGARSADCERSYSDPLGTSGATRWDDSIDYRLREQRNPARLIPAGDWNLDFFDSNRFNFYAGDPDRPYRRYLPFAVTWIGKVDVSSSTTWRALYVGEGSISIDGRHAARLSPSYGQLRRVDIPIERGTHQLQVDYTYDRTVLQAERPPEHYAAIAVVDDAGLAVGAAEVRAPWRLASALADVVLMSFVLSARMALVTTLRRSLVLALLVSIMGYIGLRLVGIGPHVIGPLEVALFVVLSMAVRRRALSLSSASALAYVSIAILEMLRSHRDFGGFDEVFLRPGGQDYLTYESQAHAVLGGSFRGEEDVFVYSPAFRYLLALGHVFFGAGDARLTTVAMTAIGVVVVAVGLRWHEEMVCVSSVTRAAFFVAVGLTLMLVAHPVVARIIRLPLSEFPTWALVPAGFGLLLGGTGRRRAVVGGCGVLGLALTVRSNQLPVILLILAIGLGLKWRREPGRRHAQFTIAMGLLVFGAVALLPAVHNVVYGDRLVLLADSSDIPLNVPLPPSDLPRICCDRDVRDVFAEQTRGVTAIGTIAPGHFVMPLRGLQLLWVASLLTAWRYPRRRRWVAGGVGALPAAALVPHLMLQVTVYYPRHVILGYVLMGLSAAYVFSQAPGSAIAESESQSSAIGAIR